MGKRNLTPIDEGKIVSLGKTGLGYKKVAKLTGVAHRRVSKIFAANGITRPSGGRLVPFGAEVEQKIRELAGQGKGYRFISKAIGRGKCKVRAYMNEHGLTQKVGTPRLPKATRDGIDAEIRGRKDFLCRIAKRYGVGTETVRRRKQKILGPAPLLSVWPPLQSKFGQADAAEFIPTPEEAFLALVRKLIDSEAGRFLRKETYPHDEMLAAKRRLKADPTPILELFKASMRQAMIALFLSDSEPVAGSEPHWAN